MAANGFRTGPAHPLRDEPRAGRALEAESHAGEKGSLRNRLDMPEAWRGLQDAALEQACGIPGAVFVHRSGHLAIAATREAALAMARACLANRPSPAEALRKAWGR
jgi:hypothetical protein